MEVKLYDGNSAFRVLSNIYKIPDILHDEKYKLSVEDFDSSKVHQMIYGAMYNLVVGHGASSLTIEDIDMYIAQFPKQQEEFNKQGGRDLLAHMSKKTEDETLMSMHYNNVKKYTVLRELQKNGISTKEFQVSAMATFEERDKWEKLTVEDIIRKVQEKVNKVENAYVGESVMSQKAAKGILELYNELKNNPEVGVSLDGDILDYILRGARFGKMYLNSAPSGHGKTRFMAGNACAISLPRIEKDGRVTVRDDLRKVLFVTTEQQADEIQTLILAYVSGVAEENILYGKATPAEEKRILQAIELIKIYQDNFIIEVIPDPSIALVRAKLVKHILQNGVEFIFYDYIFSSPGLLGEFRDVKVREDVALMMLSNTLKEIAATYNVFVQSATQLNDKWETSMVRNQNHIRGSKAIVDKADVGMTSIKLDEVPEERDRVKMIVEQAGLEMPNVVVDIYKNRRGKYAGIKLFRKFDYATCRSKDIMLTTSSHAIIVDYDKIDYDVRVVDFAELLVDATASAAKGGDK